jgi:hypothetical protein
LAFRAAEAGAGTLEIRTSSQTNSPEKNAKRRTSSTAHWAACAIKVSLKTTTNKPPGDVEVVEQFAISHHGALTVQKNDEAATTFTLWLPQTKLD